MDCNRRTTYSVLFEIEKNQAYSNLELNRQIGLQNPDNPAFVRELVYGVLENRIYLDYLLGALSADFYGISAALCSYRGDSKAC